MAALALLEDVANCALRQERIFMERNDLLHNPYWYRLQLQLWLQRRTARSRAVPGDSGWSSGTRHQRLESLQDCGYVFHCNSIDVRVCGGGVCSQTLQYSFESLPGIHTRNGIVLNIVLNQIS
ncbi:uncharacterized protein V6R79_021364 [Siganus canaliculatus]